MPSPVILCSPARRAPLGTCLPCFRFGQYTQPGLRSMSRSGTYWPLDRLPVDWKSTPCMPAIGFLGSMVLSPPLILKVATLGWPGRTAAPQPQYSEILISTSGILPGGVLPLVGVLGSIGIRVSDLPRLRPPGIRSCASTPGFSSLCNAMSRYCPVMPPARAVG